MAALITVPPPRTPSPKCRIRSQSFDSPSSRVSVTPIDDSPYSKSTGSIAAKALPRYNVAKAADQAHLLGRNKVILHTKMSDDSMLSTSSEDGDEEYEDEDEERGSSIASSPTDSETSSSSRFALFTTGSPRLLPSPVLFPGALSTTSARSPSSTSTSTSSSPSLSSSSPDSSPVPPAPTTFQIYQDPSTPMYDPWLVRVVLDMYDIRGLDWFMIAEPIERIWGFRTSSADVLGILSSNGRVGRTWWD